MSAERRSNAIPQGRNVRKTGCQNIQKVLKEGREEGETKGHLPLGLLAHRGGNVVFGSVDEKEKRGEGNCSYEKGAKVKREPREQFRMRGFLVTTVIIPKEAF